MVPEGLPTALGRLRAAISAADYPLSLTSAAEARKVGAALVAQLDDYLLPRLGRLDAPLLVVVGGSTGAGKSTLVNSIVQARVSAPGVLRPTTRAPVLVCNPADTQWFRQGDLLPGLTRTTRPSDDPHTLQLVAAPALTPGLAFLDAPDIDSVVDQNRQLAAQLLAAADLWLFVSTAARYADAVPWEMLHTARRRGTVTALVLDRVPPEAAAEVTTESMSGASSSASPAPSASEVTTRSAPGPEPVALDRPGSTFWPMNQPWSAWLTTSVGTSVVGRSTPGSVTSAPTSELTSVDFPAPVEPPTTASSGASMSRSRGSR